MFAQIFTSLLKYGEQEDTYSIETGVLEWCNKTRFLGLQRGVLNPNLFWRCMIFFFFYMIQEFEHFHHEGFCYITNIEGRKKYIW